MNRRWMLKATLASPLMVASLGVFAEKYPSRPVKLIVPWPPGGGTDIFARLVSKELAAKWGEGVVVDNRPGAAGNIGASAVAVAAPDGYTLMLATITLASNPAIYRNLTYNTEASFAPITLVAGVPHVLVVRNDFSANSVREIIAAAKKSPGAMNYSSAGSGSPFHLAAELFNRLAQISITHVPYKGGAPAIVDVIGGQVHMTFANLTAVLPYIRSGQLKALGITSGTRSSALPDVPTIAEAGVPEYEFSSWFGFLFPKGVPSEIISQANRDIVGVLNLPQIKERLTLDGANVIANSPEEFSRFLKSELRKWSEVTKAAGIVVE